MTTNIFSITVFSVLLLSSCIETVPQEKTDQKEVTKSDLKEVVSITSTSKEGIELQVSFNNTNGTAKLDFEGETILLNEVKSASGYWYKNDNYELRGKGNDLELKKDGKTVFIHEDEIVNSTIKNKEGQTLDMTFNNTTNEAKIYLNGGDQIELIGQSPASGVWYKNDHYELRGKGESIELTKDGVSIFKN